jgi:hypothetical protein
VDALPDLRTLSDPQLKELIEDLVREETQVSFERRVLQGRIDILLTDSGDGDIDIASLPQVLTGGAPRRAQEDLPPDVRRQVEEAQEEERSLSYRRRMLHGKIDILRAELTARLQRSGGRSVLADVDADRLSDLLAGKAAPTTDAEGEGET